MARPKNIEKVIGAAVMQFIGAIVGLLPEPKIVTSGVAVSPKRRGRPPGAKPVDAALEARRKYQREYQRKVRAAKKAAALAAKGKKAKPAKIAKLKKAKRPAKVMKVLTPINPPKDAKAEAHARKIQRDRDRRAKIKAEKVSTRAAAGAAGGDTTSIDQTPLAGVNGDGGHAEAAATNE